MPADTRAAVTLTYTAVFTVAAVAVEWESNGGRIAVKSKSNRSCNTALKAGNVRANTEKTSFGVSTDRSAEKSSFTVMVSLVCRRVDVNVAATRRQRSARRATAARQGSGRIPPPAAAADASPLPLVGRRSQ